MSKRNKAQLPESIPLGKLDIATCQKLKGFSDETGVCRVLIAENDKNPNEVILKAVKGYRPTPQTQPNNGNAVE